jgi:hypothetical protein
MGLLDHRVMEPNLFFLHRGVIAPGGGIGHHVHNSSEEMFVILNEGEAEFKPYGRLPFFRHLAPAAFAEHIGGRVH